MSIRVDMTWKGPEVIKTVKAAGAEALGDAAQHILDEANRIAPKDEGTLIQTSDTAVDAKALQAAVYYVVPYAARLHEHPEYRFQQGRQGKWLEKTLKDRAEAVLNWLGQAARKRLGG